MKNMTLKLAGAFLATVLTSLSYAASLPDINGRIDIGAFNSTANINFTADTVGFVGGTGGYNAQVTAASGAYATFAPTLTTSTKAKYFDFDYSLPFSPANAKIWEINATSYFTLGSLTVVNEGSTQNSLGLTGLGTAYLTGFAPSLGQWSFSADKVSGQATFSFSSTTQVPPPSVPDSGSSLALLGAAISALGLIARSRRLG